MVMNNRYEFLDTLEISKKVVAIAIDEPASQSVNDIKTAAYYFEQIKSFYFDEQFFDKVIQFNLSDDILLKNINVYECGGTICIFDIITGPLMKCLQEEWNDERLEKFINWFFDRLSKSPLLLNYLRPRIDEDDSVYSLSEIIIYVIKNGHYEESLKTIFSDDVFLPDILTPYVFFEKTYEFRFFLGMNNEGGLKYTDKPWYIENKDRLIKYVKRDPFGTLSLFFKSCTADGYPEKLCEQFGVPEGINYKEILKFEPCELNWRKNLTNVLFDLDKKIKIFMAHADNCEYFWKCEGGSILLGWVRHAIQNGPDMYGKITIQIQALKQGNEKNKHIRGFVDDFLRKIVEMVTEIQIDRLKKGSNPLELIPKLSELTRKELSNQQITVPNFSLIQESFSTKKDFSYLLSSLFFESYKAAEKFIRFSEKQKESFDKFFMITDPSIEGNSDGSPTKRRKVNSTQLVDGIDFSELFNHLFNTILEPNKGADLETIIAQDILSRIAYYLISELETKLQIKDMSGFSIFFSAGSQ